MRILDVAGAASSGRVAPNPATVGRRTPAARFAIGREGHPASRLRRGSRILTYRTAAGGRPRICGADHPAKMPSRSGAPRSTCGSLDIGSDRGVAIPLSWIGPGWWRRSPIAIRRGPTRQRTRDGGSKFPAGLAGLALSQLYPYERRVSGFVSQLQPPSLFPRTGNATPPIRRLRGALYRRTSSAPFRSE